MVRACLELVLLEECLCRQLLTCLRVHSYHRATEKETGIRQVKYHKAHFFKTEQQNFWSKYCLLFCKKWVNFQSSQSSFFSPTIFFFLKGNIFRADFHRSLSHSTPEVSLVSNFEQIQYGGSGILHAS